MLYLQPAGRTSVRPVFLPGRARAQSRVRRHAHRQPGAWRLPDARRLPARSGCSRCSPSIRSRRSPIAFVVFADRRLPLYYLLVPRLLRAKDPEMLSFILFFGLSQVIEAVTTIAFGTSERSIPGTSLAGDRDRRCIFAGMRSTAGQSSCSASISGVVAGERRRQRLRRAAGLWLSVSDAPRLSHPRGDGQSGRGARHRHRRPSRRPLSPSASASRLPRVAGVFAPFMLGSITPAMGAEINHHRLRRHRHRLARQSARHRARRHDLRHLLHADAELLQLLGQSPALRAAHRDSAGAAERAAGAAGAPVPKIARDLVLILLPVIAAFAILPASTAIICCCSTSSFP